MLFFFSFLYIYIYIDLLIKNNTIVNVISLLDVHIRDFLLYDIFADI